MSIPTLLEKLGAAGIRLRSSGGELRVAGNRAALDAELVGQLRAHKAALLDMIGGEGGEWWSPPPQARANGSPDGPCVHELFEAQVRRALEALAVEHDGRSLTYAELDARADRLAHLLRAGGVGPDARVAILVERSPEQIVALLAVLKAGGAYVPLDPAYPAERLRYVLDDSAPVALLTTRSLRATLAGLPGVPPVIEVAAEAPADRPEGGPERVEAGPGRLAYVIYTSGSTGAPKGVMVEHRTLRRQLAAVRARYGLTAGDRCLQFASATFDMSVEEIFGALVSGAALVLRTGHWLDGARAFWRLCESHRVSVVYLPTRFWQILAGEPSVPVPGCVRLVLFGGEEVDPGALSAWFASGGHRPRLLNAYGPTETTVIATVQEMAADPATWRSIGRAVERTRVYILDPQAEPVPPGARGEVHVGGGQVARGYLGRPALTAERFLADPFAQEPGARMYRTGDLGRWLPDRSIEYLGRTDFQVKIRGFRIEPGEIEACLAAHPAVRDAVVTAGADPAGEKRLVAYYTGADEAAADALRAHVAERLPEYMVPAAYVRLETLPLTPGGKVDRGALPAPEGSAYAARAYEAPLGEAEEALAGVWSAVLGVERVGRWDHFFHLGGHSLRAVQVASRVRQALGVEVEVGELFVRPVLADFARGLEGAARADLPPIERVPRDGRLALSFAQQRLWFLEQLGRAGRAYHMPAGLRLRGELDRAALRRALERIVERHEALRTTFHAVDGEPVQRIVPADAVGFHLLEHDLGGRPDAGAELERLTAEEAGAPFDLERGPLVRGRLVRLAPDEHVLLVTMHHVVSDGWSMGVLTHELSALYGAFRRGEADPLPELPVQYADYAAWQRRWVTGEVLQRQGDFWKRTLSGAPELLELAGGRPRPARQDLAGGFVPVVLEEALAVGLNELGRRHGTTLFMTLLAGWAATLSRLSGQEDVVVGTPSANRGRREVEGLIGFFVNTLALRLDLSGTPTVAELLGRVKARALEAQRHQDIPFEQVVELVRPGRTLSHSPLFQVMFAWQNAPPGGLELPGLTLGSAGAAPHVSAPFDLALSLQEAGGRIVGGVEYATALFERPMVERYVGCLRAVLGAMAANDRETVDRLPLMGAEERRLVLEAGRDELEVSL